MPDKQVDTAIKVVLGPCIDDTDFKTREEALTYDQAGMEIDAILEKHDGKMLPLLREPGEYIFILKLLHDRHKDRYGDLQWEQVVLLWTLSVVAKN